MTDYDATVIIECVVTAIIHLNKQFHRHHCSRYADDENNFCGVERLLMVKKIIEITQRWRCKISLKLFRKFHEEIVKAISHILYFYATCCLKKTLN